MYHRHFGLSDPPFRFTVSPGALYEGREHREAMAALTWGLLHEPTGYTLLVGEPGTGKTTIAHAVLAEHRSQVHSAFLNYPKAEPLELFRYALRELGSDATAASKYDCAEAFRGLLREVGPEQHVALVFDEAQALSPLLFEELRLLGNYAAFGDRRVKIIFIGQPSILKRLGAPMLRQLNERIGTRVSLQPIGERDVLKYVNHRLKNVNGSADRIFASKALRLIATHSNGVPRRIDVLCHNAMLAAYAAGEKRVSARQIRAVIDEFENIHVSLNSKTTEGKSLLRRRLWKIGASVAFVSGIGMVGHAGLKPEVVAQEISNAIFLKKPAAASRTTSHSRLVPTAIDPEGR
jgi:type II secretory pathway predicted ATPase ExeA